MVRERSAAEARIKRMPRLFRAYATGSKGQKRLPLFPSVTRLRTISGMKPTATLYGPIPPGRGVYCNRTLNLRSIRAIGYDMDYTLIHYNAEEWERLAYEFIRDRLAESGWPVAGLTFDPGFVIQGLIIDRELGNIIKANRFGYVKRAAHGTRMLDHEAQRQAYGRVVVDLADPRWFFLNTLFSLSEACLYAQLVDLLDAGVLKDVHGYPELYSRVRQLLDEAHMEGQIKSRIIENPSQFVVLDELAPKALLDQRDAGKRLLLITNSEWSYTRALMAYAFDPFLPGGMTWRDLFEVMVVGARKPVFFSESAPFFELVDETGLLRPCPGGVKPRGIYVGGNALRIERDLGLQGSDILYVGDHIYADVHVSKSIRRWRTAVVLRDLENEIAASEAFGPTQDTLDTLMADKVDLEREYSQLRLEQQHRQRGLGPRLGDEGGSIQERMTSLRGRLVALDAEIQPLAISASQLSNSHWGLLMRTGNDKSYLARQIERHADVYTSRVSNFAYESPFVFLRSPRGSLPHDR